MSVFQKIIDGEIPVEFLHEDESCVAFYDQNPQAPIHVLVVPRKPLKMLEDADLEDEALLGRLMLVANKVAKQLSLETGYRVVINNGPDACQSVYHLHVHLLGGRGFSWPPG
ncbi:histidine triad nucleotide-binding protein [Candidatus Synchoanobacter obligatus]|uniref:Histidine triad nucleotide-binding protein n=1 Tax=Candidatus Synchoanobacter obligatus TaxID=2919597 RepID=A0ABT1L4I7_9GAMM|nr:histidine triad nucleotide-binding protein [Candidatus Synchoanobacter obligatus]MCP8352077.1 histidine triad nucleotide-binding protein [Candidatus Synchoanobacter obligatus]